MWNFEKSKCKIFEGPHEKVWRAAYKKLMMIQTLNDELKLSLY